MHDTINHALKLNQSETNNFYLMHIEGNISIKRLQLNALYPKKPIFPPPHIYCEHLRYPLPSFTQILFKCYPWGNSLKEYYSQIKLQHKYVKCIKHINLYMNTKKMH